MEPFTIKLIEQNYNKSLFEIEPNYFNLDIIKSNRIWIIDLVYNFEIPNRTELLEDNFFKPNYLVKNRTAKIFFKFFKKLKVIFNIFLFSVSIWFNFNFGSIYLSYDLVLELFVQYGLIH